MTTKTFNPVSEEQRLLWRIRRDDWRERSLELSLQALAVLGVLVVLVLLLVERMEGFDRSVAYLLHRWRLPAALCSLWLLYAWQRQRMHRWQRFWAEHWLRAQPMADSIPRTIQRQRILSLALLQSLLGACVLFRQQHGWHPLIIWIALVFIAGTAVAWQTRRTEALRAATTRRRTHIGPALGRGGFFSWQLNEAIACFAPSRSAPLALLLLLVPAPIGGWRMLLVVATLMLLGWCAAAWRSSIGVLPAAAQWLSAEALPGRRLMIACLPFPAMLLAFVLMFLCGLLFVFNASRWCWALSASMLVPAALHFAVAAAERRRPARIPFQLGLQLIMVVAVLQALPLLVMPVVLIQLIWLWRKGVSR